MATKSKSTKSNSSVRSTQNIDSQLEDAIQRAELFEARARISLAQAEISRGHLERSRYLSEMEALSKRSTKTK